MEPSQIAEFLDDAFSGFRNDKGMSDLVAIAGIDDVSSSCVSEDKDELLDQIFFVDIFLETSSTPCYFEVILFGLDGVAWLLKRNIWMCCSG